GRPPRATPPAHPGARPAVRVEPADRDGLRPPRCPSRRTSTLEDHLEYEWGLQAKRLSSDEFREGVAAFLEKREPN
ncbi:MAG: hypothetical protein ACSLFM_01935, partial [Tepidiformaceae bacterium]